MSEIKPVKEIWKPIKDFPEYWVSNLGKVKSLKNYGHSPILKGAPIKSGYWLYCLMNRHGSKTLYAHRLVFEAFGEVPDYPYEVFHKDGNKKRNCIMNLKAVAQTDKSHMVGKKKNRIPKEKREQVLDLFNRHNIEDISEMTGLTIAQIQAIQYRTNDQEDENE